MSAASAKGAAVVVEEDVPCLGMTSMFVSLGASIFAKMVVGVFYEELAFSDFEIGFFLFVHLIGHRIVM